MLVAILWCAIGGLVGAAIGQNKGRPGEAFLLGFILGPIGWLLVATGPSSAPKCPHCGGAVDPNFSACRHCGRDLKPTAEESSTSILSPPIQVETPERACPLCGGMIHPEATRCRHCMSPVPAAQ